MAWSPDAELRGYFKGTTNCLSALLAAGRHEELLELLDMAPYKMWHYRQYGVKALAAMGRKAEAIRYAEEGRGLNDSPVAIARACEEMLLSSGLAEEAYEKYGLLANEASTYLAWFRAVAKKHPHRAKAEVLADLGAHTPGDEGKCTTASSDTISQHVMLQFDRPRLVAQARLRYLCECIAHVHYPLVSLLVAFEENESQGTFLFDNTSGDLLSLVWSAHGIVGLVFAHESPRSKLEPEAGVPTRWLPGLPASLVHLAEDAAQDLDQLATAGLWARENEHAHLSDPVDRSTRWAHGLEMLVRFGMNPREAIFEAPGDTWLEIAGLSSDQAELALRLSCDVPRVLTKAESAILLEPPADAGGDISTSAVREAADMMRRIGIVWNAPMAPVMHQPASEDEHAKHQAPMSPDTALLFAISDGDLEAVRSAVEAGASVDACTGDNQFDHIPAGETALMMALRKGHGAIAMSLLQSGATYATLNEYGQTPLYWAASRGFLDVVKSLLKKGVDPNLTHSRWTPLHVAAAEGHQLTVAALLDAGATRNQTNERGHTPADLAEMRGHDGLAAKLRL